MIEKFKCSGCRKIYEITWNDGGSNHFDEEEDSWTEDDDDTLDPSHCPFCGEHLVYGDDSYEL